MAKGIASKPRFRLLTALCMMPALLLLGEAVAQTSTGSPDKSTGDTSTTSPSDSSDTSTSSGPPTSGMVGDAYTINASGAATGSNGSANAPSFGMLNAQTISPGGTNSGPSTVGSPTVGMFSTNTVSTDSTGSNSTSTNSVPPTVGMLSTNTVSTNNGRVNTTVGN